MHNIHHGGGDNIKAPVGRSSRRHRCIQVGVFSHRTTSDDATPRRGDATITFDGAATASVRATVCLRAQSTAVDVIDDMPLR